MPCVVLGCVHPLSERHVGRRLHNVGAALLCVLIVLVDLINRDEYVCRDLGSLRCPVRSALTTEHDGSLGDRELRMTSHAVTFCTEALGEAERPTEPLNRLIDILVDQIGTIVAAGAERFFTILVSMFGSLNFVRPNV